jgi:hypothetical protein
MGMRGPPVAPRSVPVSALMPMLSSAPRSARPSARHWWRAPRCPRTARPRFRRATDRSPRKPVRFDGLGGQGEGVSGPCRRPEGGRSRHGRRVGNTDFESLAAGAQFGPLVRTVGGRRHRFGHVGLVAGQPVDDRPETAVPAGQLALPFQKLCELGFHQMLIEQLAAGDPVDLRAQHGDAVFISLLHARLARRVGADQIVAQDQIGGGGEIADRHGRNDRPRQRGHPRPDGEMADLVATRDDDCVRFAAFSERGFRGVFDTTTHSLPAIAEAGWITHD